MVIYSKSLCRTAVALSLFTALTSAAHAQAVIMDDSVVSGSGQDVVMVPEQDVPIRPRGSIVEDSIGLKLQLGVSRVDLTAHELVYDGSRSYGKGKTNKISELIWESKNVVMFGGKASIAVSSRINIHGEAWLAGYDESHMDDYDWLDPDRTEWTDWSTHEDTEIDRGYILDVALGFSALRTERVVIDLLAGYKRDSWKWVAKGGDYIYSTDPTNGDFRDSEGFFTPGELGITYEQSYSTPYLGVAADINLGPLNLAGKAIGSHWAKASNIDTHHLRNTKFKDDLHNGKMYMLEGEASFALTQRFAVGAGYSYTKYDHTRGEGSANDTAYWGDGVGSDQEYSKVKIFVNGKF